MKNFTDPIQTKADYLAIHLGTEYTISLYANTLEDFTDKIGFIQKDPVEYSFMQFDGYKEKPHTKTNKMRIIINLDDRLINYEREAYTVFTLLGDLGGFNSAIIILPAYLLNIYSERMF